MQKIKFQCVTCIQNLETNYNKESLYKALDRQWGGVDDVNSIMWLLK